MFTIIIQSLSGFDTTQEQFARNAMNKFQSVMNSDALRRKTLDFTSTLGQRFEDNQGLTNLQVYEKLMAGSETYEPEVDFSADLFLVLKKRLAANREIKIFFI